MRKRFVAALLLGLILTVGYAPIALAHGERAQEAFLKMKTVAYWDVQFSTDTVKQGEQVVITGTAKILETWPTTLPEPEVAFIGVAAPGPVMVMRERTVNGKPAPGSIFVKKGGVYQFRMVLEGRRPGRWHIHPIVAVEGAGSLLGPGQWIEVQEAAGMKTPLTLLNGQTVDLENYGLNLVLVLSFIGFGLGVWYMLYWTVPKRTVTRLAVTNQLNLNDDGSEVGLITRKDHRFVNLMAGLTVVLLAVGWGYSAKAFPVQIPQQVIRFEPPPLPEEPQFVQARATGATWDPHSKALVLEVQVTNLGQQPVQVADFRSSTLAFYNEALNPQARHRLRVDTDAIAPGETRTITVTIQDAALEDERLIPIGESQMSVTGVLTFQQAGGGLNRLTIESGLVPTHWDF